MTPSPLRRLNDEHVYPQKYLVGIDIALEMSTCTVLRCVLPLTQVYQGYVGDVMYLPTCVNATNVEMMRRAGM